MPHRLIVVIGPTGVGKSAYAIRLAQDLHCPIISSDSRQVYRGMTIGTDAPRESLLNTIPHYLVACREVWQPYSASDFAHDAERLLDDFAPIYPDIVMVGGSMLYLQALLFGLSDAPAASPEVRQALWREYHAYGATPLRERLKVVDPVYLSQIDPNNHKRIIRALEVYETTGKPFSSYHKESYPRPLGYDVELHLVTRPRPQLYERINARVAQMMDRGLVEEVKRLAPYRNENALNTIGYKEVFQYLDGDIPLHEAQSLIAKHTRTYARQQISFFTKWCKEGSPFRYQIVSLTD